MFVDGLDVRADGRRLTVGQGVAALMEAAPEVVFPVMHGPYGEDGRFQALMELLHLRYVGSPPDASALAMNKARARDVLARAGLVVFIYLSVPSSLLQRSASTKSAPPRPGHRAASGGGA